MKLYNVGFNDYYHTAYIHLDEVPFVLYYLGEFVMWICGYVPSIPFPKFIHCKTPEGLLTMREWYGDTQQWFHCNICIPVFHFVHKYTKPISIPLPYDYLKDLFPEEGRYESEWDLEDKQFRQLTREMSWKHEKEFKVLVRKMDYQYIKAECEAQVGWYL